MKYLLLLFVSTSAMATYLPFQLSSGGSLLRIESAHVTGSTCAATQQTSTNWISSVVHNSTGNCSLVVTGTFSSNPVCQLTATNNNNFLYVSSATTGTINPLGFAVSNQAASDADFNISCVGGY